MSNSVREEATMICLVCGGGVEAHRTQYVALPDGTVAVREPRCSRWDPVACEAGKVRVCSVCGQELPRGAFCWEHWDSPAAYVGVVAVAQEAHEALPHEAMESERDGWVHARCSSCGAEHKVEPDAEMFDCDECGAQESVTSPLRESGLI